MIEYIKNLFKYLIYFKLYPIMKTFVFLWPIVSLYIILSSGVSLRTFIYFVYNYFCEMMLFITGHVRLHKQFQNMYEGKNTSYTSYVVDIIINVTDRAIYRMDFTKYMLLYYGPSLPYYQEIGFTKLICSFMICVCFVQNYIYTSFGIMFIYLISYYS